MRERERERKRRRDEKKKTGNTSQYSYAWKEKKEGKERLLATVPTPGARLAALTPQSLLSITCL